MVKCAIFYLEFTCFIMCEITKYILSIEKHVKVICLFGEDSNDYH